MNGHSGQSGGGGCCLVARSSLTRCEPMTVTLQAPLSMGFSRQEYKNGLPFPSPGDLPHPGIKSESPVLQVDSLPPESPGKPHREAWSIINVMFQNGGKGEVFNTDACRTASWEQNSTH